MTSDHNDKPLDWHDIEEHTLTLRGIETEPGVAPSITFAAKIVLAPADSIHDPLAIGFDTTIRIPHRHATGPLIHTGCHGMYSSLSKRRMDFQSLRDGNTPEARISMEGFELRVFQHKQGSRSGLCVDGVVSSVRNIDQFPWPKRIGDWILADNSSAYAFQFAFRTSLVDPPHVDNFIRDMDKLLAHLQLWANPDVTTSLKT